MEAVNNLKYVVYCTTNKVNKKIYIGVHKTYTNEFDGYLGCGVYNNKPYTYQQCKTVFQRAVTKYGPNNFIRETIATFNTEEEAMELEQELVDSQFLEREDVYNMILGGYGNKNMKPRIKCYCYDLNGNFIKEYESIREAGRIQSNSEFTFREIKNAIIDKVTYLNLYWSLCKYEKLNLSEYKKDRRHRVKVYQYNANKEFECEYNSIKEACKANNTCASSIDKACKLGYLSKNKYFSYEKYTKFNTDRLNYLKSIPVYCYDIKGNFIKEYPNEKAAVKDLHIKGSIMKALCLGCTHNNKYQFSFSFLDRMIDRTKEKKTTAKKIDQYDLSGNFIKTWNSIKKCCESLKISSNSITRILNGTQNKTKKFTFKLHKD